MDMPYINKKILNEGKMNWKKIDKIIVIIGLCFAYGACVAIIYLLILNYTTVPPLAKEPNLLIRNIEIVGMCLGVYAISKCK